MKRPSLKSRNIVLEPKGSGFTILKETPTYVISVYGKETKFNRPSKDKKFLCIGGPFNGEKKASVQLTPDTYVRFNRARKTRPFYFLPKSAQITQVFIHIATYL